MANALQRDLMQLVKAAEDAASRRPRTWAQTYHLMPPVGWLNDPNGLYQKDGVFHAYFQYAPFDVEGGVKMWGHSTSSDLVSWTYEGCALYPDEPFDCHGVYSGSALVLDDHVSVFYTGNVKLPDGNGAYDYINTGREGNTVMVDTADGETFGEKRLLLGNADYPADLSCHVRDPKVWRADAPCGRYLMVLGARRRGAAEEAGPAKESVPASPSPRRELFVRCHGASCERDAGEVLVYASDELQTWRLQNRIQSSERFGFMWECPDYFELDALQVLSFSPQGLFGGDWEHRNVYQSGYVPFAGDICGRYELGTFRLWDAGFDFYAPQTFVAEDGRRILMGWMGMPEDATYGNDPTIVEGWQHCFTVPRELTAGNGGVVLQRPVRELASLRGQAHRAVDELHLDVIPTACDIALEDVGDEMHVVLGEELELFVTCDPDERLMRFVMRFRDAGRNAASCGRTERWERVNAVRSVRILVDTSSVEVFVNEGELVMSTRWYPRSRSCAIRVPGARITCWELSANGEKGEL